MTDWNDASPNAYHLTVDTNTPAVVACGPSYAGEFVRASTEYIYQGSLTIPSAATAGGFWSVFQLRSGASTAAFHTLISIGSTSGIRWIELDIHPISSALYAGMYANTNSSLTYAYINSPALDATWHSILLEQNSAANTSRFWLDGTEYTGGSLTTSGTQGNWLSDWTSFSPTRIGIGVGVRNSPAEPGDVKIFDAGFFHGTLGSDGSNLLGHMAARRALAV